MPADFQRFRARIIVPLLALAAILAPAPAARAAEKGLQTDLTWGISAEDQQRSVQALEGTGVQWIRLDISWAAAEPTPGTYDQATLAMTDHALDLVEQLGARVIMMVNETPQWASGAANRNTPPRDPADYADFMRDMAARYAGRVAAWEVWNEPNHPRFWYPQPDAAAYARLLSAAYPAIKAGDPAAKVLFGGVAFNDYEYVDDVYAADPAIGDAFDVMATHPYTASGRSPHLIDFTADGRMTTTSFLAFQEVRDAMRARGEEKPIWLTEFGWSTNSNVTHPLGGVTEDQQATYLERALKLLEMTRYVEVAIVYNFRNNYWAHEADTWEDQLGLLRTDFSPKPAYFAFKRYSAPSGDHQPPGVPPPPAPIAPPETVPQAEQGPELPSISLRARRIDNRVSRIARVGKVAFRVHGRVSAAGARRARIVLERRGAGGWKRVRTIHIPVRGTRFVARLSVRSGARWRATAVSDFGGARLRSRPVALRG